MPLRLSFCTYQIALIIVFLLFCPVNVLFAQVDSTALQHTVEIETDTSSLQEKADRFNKKMERLVKLFPVPIFSVSKETGMLFGLTKFNDFNIGDTAKTISDSSKTQPSTVIGLFYYTQKKQLKLNAETDLMFHKNSENLKARISYLHFPLLFFGVGDDTKKEDGVTVLYEDFQIVTSFSHRIFDKTFAGVSYKYLNALKVEYADPIADSASPIIDSVDIGKNAGLTSGLGLVFTYEGRDNRLNPFSGSYFNIELEFFESWIGSDFQYTRLFVDMRKYYPVLPDGKLVVAGQVLGEFVTDGSNIQGLPALGGPDWGARGIYFGRFRDKSSLAANLELRFPLFWIFGGTLFGGGGQVQPSLAEFKWDKNHYIYGAGFRVQVSSKNRVNLRFDLGFSGDDMAFIIDFTEAF